MPTEASVLGFSNRWYPMAIVTAQRFDIAEHGTRIQDCDSYGRDPFQLRDKKH